MVEQEKRGLWDGLDRVHSLYFYILSGGKSKQCWELSPRIGEQCRTRPPPHHHQGTAGLPYSVYKHLIFSASPCQLQTVGENQDSGFSALWHCLSLLLCLPGQRVTRECRKERTERSQDLLYQVWNKIIRSWCGPSSTPTPISLHDSWPCPSCLSSVALSSWSMFFLVWTSWVCLCPP